MSLEGTPALCSYELMHVKLCKGKTFLLCNLMLASPLMISFLLGDWDMSSICGIWLRGNWFGQIFSLSNLCFSLLFSCQVMSNSLLPHELQCTRLPCPSPHPAVCSSSCPLHQWSHPTTSSSVALVSFCLQSFPASGSFPVSWLVTSGDQVLELQLQH